MRQKVFLLALALLLPLTTFAWSNDDEGGYDFEVDSIYYTIDSSETVSVCTKRWAKDAGDKFHNLEVSYRGNIVIPETVTYNGITYTVRRINDYAFSRCRDLISITIPKSVRYIGERAFDKCSGLESIQVDLDNSVFDSRENCNAIIQTATNTLIAGCKNTIIPNSITTIGCEAFCGRTGLTSIEIPNSVTTIASGKCEIWWWGIDDNDGVTGAFLGCTSLSEIVIPSSVTTIGAGAFYGCTGLTRVEIGESVSSISNTFLYEGYIDSPGAFEGCTGIMDLIWNARNCSTNGNMRSENIERVTIGEQVERIFSGFVSGSKITSLSIPSSVTSIGDYAFRNCPNLANINVDSNNTVFDSRDTCNAIIATATNTLVLGCKNTTIPNSVTRIGNSAFSGCSGLISIDIPNSVTEIGSSAFESCIGLTSIEIPISVISIGSSAFSGCSYFVNVTCRPRIPPTINYSTFDCYGTATLLIPRKSYNAYRGAYGWKEFNRIQPIFDVEAEGIYYDFTSDSTVCVSCIDENYFSDCGDVIIPESVYYDGKDYIVDAIDESAFYNCSSLTNVSIPNTVKSIGSYAFLGCNNLTSVIIPDSVTTIGDYVFNGCSGLTSLTIGKSVTGIGSYAFFGCNNLTSVIIPDSVTSIGGYAFNGCSGLTSLTIGKSVSTIYSRAFYNCNNLNKLTWNAINCASKGDMSTSNIVTVTIGSEVEVLPGSFISGSRVIDVTIPNSVTTIGRDAFLNCNALSKVTVSDVSSWCKIAFSDYYSNPLYYSHHLYLNNHEIKHLIIPDDVTSISSYAFVNGTSFIELTLPNTLESIGGCAFEGCKRLTNITLGSSMSYLGPAAFKDCSALNLVSCMATTPPSMGAVNCFDSDCYDWATLYVPGDKVEEYNRTMYWNKFANTVGTGIEVDCIYYLFNFDTSEATVTYKDQTYCSYSGDVVIPESVNHDNTIFTVTGIGEAAFAYCDELTSVTIPNTVASIGDYAFIYCENLPSIDIPNAVTSIGDNAFDGCSSFSKIEIPNSVLTIGEMAFQGCTNVTDLTIGSGVTQIGAKAFNYCNALNTVTCKGNTPPRMDNSNCFTSYGYQAKLLVPHASIDDYKSANYWYKFAAIEGFDVSEPGDINGDGGINISDVTSLIDQLLSGGEALPSADVNGDGQVNISDVTALIDRLLSGN